MALKVDHSRANIQIMDAWSGEVMAYLPAPNGTREFASLLALAPEMRAALRAIGLRSDCPPEIHRIAATTLKKLEG